MSHYIQPFKMILTTELKEINQESKIIQSFILRFLENSLTH